MKYSKVRVKGLEVSTVVIDEITLINDIWNDTSSNIQLIYFDHTLYRGVRMYNSTDGTLVKSQFIKLATNVTIEEAEKILEEHK